MEEFDVVAFDNKPVTEREQRFMDGINALSTYMKKGKEDVMVKKANKNVIHIKMKGEEDFSGAFALPSQRVVCPKCKDDYFSDGVKQQCPYCKEEFNVTKNDVWEE